MATAGARLPAWTPGCLDIHHIATGRGSATLVIMPDGTSMLIDAGATSNGLDVSAAPRPGATRRPGEWVARYAQRHLQATGRPQLDYLLVTHLHPDHTGDVGDASPPSTQGPYHLASGRLTPQLRSRDGHVVVRVAPDGATYTVYVTDNGDENDTILSQAAHAAT